MSNLKDAIPAVEVYAGVGNPYKTSLDNHQKNIKAQAELNNKHGGTRYMNGMKSRKRERKRIHRGGTSTNTDSRPAKLVVPQAPTGGMEPQGPIDGNSINTGASRTILHSHVNSEYDSLVKVPPIPPPPPTVQNGGSLINRLEGLIKKRKTRRRQKGKGKKRTNRRRKSHKKK